MKVIHTHFKNVEIPELCHRESEILCGLIPEASVAEMLLLSLFLLILLESMYMGKAHCLFRRHRLTEGFRPPWRCVLGCPRAGKPLDENEALGLCFDA